MSFLNYLQLCQEKQQLNVTTSQQLDALLNPPQRIPAHYSDKVEEQLEDMLKQEIIQESSSPLMAPAVFVPKKSGEIRICIDYRELNKKTTKDAYPLPLPDEVQDRLACSCVFSTLDLQCGYWQIPLSPDDRAKTAFCLGPGMGLFEFTRMPFFRPHRCT